MLQLDHYKISSIKNYLLRYYFKLPFIVITYLSIFLLLKNTYLNILIYVFIIVFSLIKQNYVIKLKFTKRIIRLLITMLLIISLPFIFTFDLSAFLLILLLLPLITFISMIVTYPYEKFIYTYYKNKSKKKLENINPFIIEITGSYGKTTIKNMLYSIYSPYYLTLSTPKSYNTPMGISKTILNDLENLTEIFIVEAGATSTGDIKEITKMINPDIGIITNIGTSHIGLLNGKKNIFKAKLEIKISSSTFEYIRETS